MSPVWSNTLQRGQVAAELHNTKAGDEMTATTRLLRFTTAPAVYDGFSTREESACVGHDRDKVVRAISFEPKDEKWQEGRNGSGMHFTVDEAGWQKMVAAGFVTANAPAKADPPPVNVTAETAAKIIGAAVALFHVTDRVNNGVWQVPHSAMRKLVAELVAAGVNV